MNIIDILFRIDSVRVLLFGVVRPVFVVAFRCHLARCNQCFSFFRDVLSEGEEVKRKGTLPAMDLFDSGNVQGKVLSLVCCYLRESKVIYPLTD